MDVIIDCYDNSYQEIHEKGGNTKWKEIKEVDKAEIRYKNNFCERILSLENSPVKIYEKGQPNETDKLAITALKNKI